MRRLPVLLVLGLLLGACAQDPEPPRSFPIIGERVWARFDDSGSVSETATANEPVRVVSVQLSCTGDSGDQELTVTTPLGTAGQPCPNTSREGSISQSLADGTEPYPAGDLPVRVDAPDGVRWSVAVTVNASDAAGIVQ
ncbi:MAG: hypothetical protein NTV28_10620 [Propionibacteriales bacterium]|nr:hypothetical protein [Propionibacteriales bacterium]